MTYHGLDICHRMVQTHTNNPNQLVTSIDCCGIRPLVVAPVPLLRASLHLSCIVGSQGQMLKTTTSGHGTRRNEVVERKPIKGPKRIPRTLYSLVNRLSQRIGSIRIIMGGPSILDIVSCLELFETLHPGVVNILGIGDELRRRRSVGSRHFEWRTG